MDNNRRSCLCFPLLTSVKASARQSGGQSKKPCAWLGVKLLSGVVSVRYKSPSCKAWFAFEPCGF